MKSARFTASDLTIDFDAGTVEKNGETIVLPDLTWRTLCCLANRSGAVVTVDELISQVWGDKSVSNETVTQRIKLLRRALGDDGQNPRYIETVRNRGFRFVPKTHEQGSKRSTEKRFVTAGLLVITGVIGLFFFVKPGSVPPPADSELTQLIARGNEYLSRIQNQDNQRAISIFEEALKRDSNNTDALLGLSFAASHNSSKFNYPIDWARRGEELARRAIVLDAGAQAHHALAFALDCQGKTDAAIEQYELALELAPDHAGVMSSIAYLYQVRGQLAWALDYGRRAHALNPNVSFTEVQVAATLHLLERDLEAREWIDRGLILKPDNVFIYSVKTNYLTSLGQFGAALDTIEEAMTNGVERPELLVYQGLIAAADDRWEDARSAFAAADAISPTRQTGYPYRLWVDLVSEGADAEAEAVAYVSKKDSAGSPADLLPVAGLQVALNNPNAALEVLSRSVDEGYRDWRMLNRHPMLADLQTLPSFNALLQRVKSLVAIEREKADDIG